MRPRPTGFTLLELLMATSVAAILALVALPALQGAIAKTRIADRKAELQGALLRSVSRAANAGTPVVLCAARADDCSGSIDWSSGWIAFHDLDGNRTRSAGDVLVAAHRSDHDAIRVLSTAGRTRLVFQPSGGNAGSNVTFTLCDPNEPSSRAVTLVLSNAGRLRQAPASPSHAASCIEPG